MSLKKVIESVKNLPVQDVEDGGLIRIISEDNKSVIVFDRDKKEFVNCYKNSLSRKPRVSIPDIYDDLLGINYFFGDGMSHAVDLVHITKKYGLRTALHYEVKVFKSDFKQLLNQSGYVN